MNTALHTGRFCVLHFQDKNANYVLLSDCAYRNIMMDAAPMYPQSFHPTLLEWLPDDITIRAPYCSRSRAPSPIRYYFIDFGLSSQFSLDETNRLVVGSKGLDGEVPELSDDIPYDPFRLDVFVIGNLFHQRFLKASVTLTTV